VVGRKEGRKDDESGSGSGKAQDGKIYLLRANTMGTGTMIYYTRIHR
jgi:hypothetical protein